MCSSDGGARPWGDFAWLGHAHLDGRLRLDELVMRRLPLAEINEGFTSMMKCNGVRTVRLLNEEVRV